MGTTPRRLRAFDIVDRSGFGRPVISMTGVMPASWEVLASTVAYGPASGCAATAVTTAFRITSPDRRVGLELFPATHTVWFDDPVAEVMYGSSVGAGGGCPRDTVMDAPVYVRHRLLPHCRTGGVVVAAEPVELLTRAMDQRARRVTDRNQMLRSLTVDVSLVTVAYPGHATEERFLVPTVVQGQVLDARDTARPPQQWASYRPFIVGTWAPQGEWEEHRASFEMILGSLMQSSDWLDMQRQLSVATGRALSSAARDRRLVWEAELDPERPTLFGAFRDHTSGTAVFPVTVWSCGGARFALDATVRRVWLTPHQELLAVDDEACEPPEDGLTELHRGVTMVRGERVATEAEGATRLASPKGMSGSGGSATSGLAGGRGSGGSGST